MIGDKRGFLYGSLDCTAVTSGDLENASFWMEKVPDKRVQSSAPDVQLYTHNMYSALSISRSPFSRSFGPNLIKSITALARDHVRCRWYAVDRPRMRRDGRRLRVHVMTLQTTDLRLLLARKRFPEYPQVVQCVPRPMDVTDADPARLHGVLSCTFSVSRSLLLSRSLLARVHNPPGCYGLLLLGWSTYRECTVHIQDVGSCFPAVSWANHWPHRKVASNVRPVANAKCTCM